MWQNCSNTKLTVHNSIISIYVKHTQYMKINKSKLSSRRRHKQEACIKNVWIKIENLQPHIRMWYSWHWKIGVRNIFAYLTLRKEISSHASSTCHMYVCEIKPFTLHRKSLSYDKVWCVMKRMKREDLLSFTSLLLRDVYMNVRRKMSVIRERWWMQLMFKAQFFFEKKVIFQTFKI